jgi:CHASE1-domain containing sensor protein
LWHAPYLLPCAVAALIGIAVSVACWFAATKHEDRLAELELNGRAHSHRIILQEEIGDYLDKLVALRALFAASNDVSRAEFMTFSQFILEGHPAILGFSWIPHITHAQRDTHEIAAVAEGLPGYQIKSPQRGGGMATSAVMPEYFPMFYSSAEKPDSPIYGLNLNDGGVRQEPLERARDHNQLAVSRTFTLRAGEGNRAGFFAVLPVYRHGAPTGTVQQRRENLLGFVQGVFQITVMIESVLRTATTPAGLDLYFFAEDAGLDAAPIYVHASRVRSEPFKQQARAALVAGPHRTDELAIGDRRWTLIAAGG